MADIRQQAVATAYAYDQGNIAVLNDETTRRLVASVALTESRGGNPELTSRQGFVGSFQHGAQALANADFVDRDKLATAMTGYKTEWAFANAGGMTQFLENRDNWKHGLSLDAFKQSPELQNEAFKRNAERAYDRGVSEGVLKEGDRPEKIAGFLKVEHVMGYGHAKAAANGERVFRAPDGTSNYDYMHDLTRDRDGLGKYIAQAREQSQVAPANASPANIAPTNTAPNNLASTDTTVAAPLLNNPNHREFERFQRAYDMLDTVTPFASDAHRTNAAGFIAMKSMEQGMQIEGILENKRGELFPIQDLGKAYEKTFKVDRTQAEAFPLAEASRQTDDLGRKAAVTQDNPQQVRAHAM